MRKLMLLTALFSPLVLADSLSVAPHTVLRLANKSSVVHLERLDVADSATLLLPGNLVELKVDQLTLGRDARIAIVPSPETLRLDAGQVQLGEGSQFAAVGAPGTYERPARPGRNLDLRLHRLQASQLFIDARGGAGAPGYVGLDGAHGKAGGCTWGAASRGANGDNGDNGGDGHDGAAGGQVRLAIPADYPAQQIKVRLEGGAPGAPGAAGKAGQGGASKGCLVYRTEAGADGRPGAAGQPGVAGASGVLSVQRL